MLRLTAFLIFVFGFLTAFSLHNPVCAQFTPSPEVTSGTLSWTAQPNGSWVASATNGSYKLWQSSFNANYFTTSAIVYTGSTTLVKPNATNCSTWYYNASLTGKAFNSGFGGGDSTPITVDTLTGTHPYTNCATPTPTATPTATPTPSPKLTLSSDRTAICAGGWDDSRHAYEYLEKETGQWKARDQKPDPHIATLTATLVDQTNGQPMAGKTVTFSWDMPGPAPAESKTAVTDAQGKATMDAVSGDEVSLNNPVAVTASYAQVEEQKNLSIEPPQIVWQFKNEQGNYVEWNGETFGLYPSRPNLINIPLRVLLTFAELPVKGHKINWSLAKIHNKAGAVVGPSNPTYATYGHMSGMVSTTPIDGGATATFTRGYNVGQIVFQIDDSSVLDRSVSVATNTVALNARFALTQHPWCQGQTSPAPKPLTSQKSALAFDYYKWVSGPAGWVAQNVGDYPYPAPGGEEDNELMSETLSLVRSVLSNGAVKPLYARQVPRSPYTEWLTPGRNPFDLSDEGAYPNGGSTALAGNWWFSQVIGADPASAKYHYADMKLIKNGRTYLYGAAFDIVLTNVAVFEEAGKRIEFKFYVQDLRDSGIVAWHRWADEPGSDENEMHCIDPATPFVKKPLKNGYYTRNNQQKKGQIKAFLDGETGGSSYLRDWTITPHQKSAVLDRATRKRDALRTSPKYLNAAPVNWPNKQ